MGEPFRCKGKVRYIERRRARAESKGLKKLTGRKYKLYHCRTCTFWHIGTRKASV